MFPWGHSRMCLVNLYELWGAEWSAKTILPLKGHKIILCIFQESRDLVCIFYAFSCISRAGMEITCRSSLYLPSGPSHI